MIATLRAILNRHPAWKAAARSLLRPLRGGTSTDYEPLAEAARGETLRQLEGAWKDGEIPRLQREGVERALAEFRAGAPVPAFDSFAALLRPLAQAAPGQSLLEIGCSSGYYSEVLVIAGLDLRYTGSDFSPAFVELARRCHPGHGFDVADATALPYADESFDIVVSGCCLLHIPDYAKAIAETARVARRHALFHRTPVLHVQPTRYFTKRAYGVRTVEIHFRRAS
jgi:SAM-dependent methyltransferase